MAVDEARAANLPLEGRSKLPEAVSGGGSDLQDNVAAGSGTPTTPSRNRSAISTSPQGGGWPSSKPGEIKTLTFGCRLNALESGVMRARAEAAGLHDAVLVNTCAVTAEAVRQAKQAIRRARRDNPAARIVVSGCAAQVDPAEFAAMPEVDLVLGNAEKLTAAAYRDFGLGDTARVRVNDIMSVRETAGHLIEGMDAHSRAFVEVQNGCDHRCTFCIIPYGRGNSRSVPMGAVVAQIRALVENGYREVVLTGVDITSYGGDLPGAPSLGRLVKSILRNVPELERLRLSSIDSIEADTALFDAIAGEERLMPHLHLSLQHGDDLILKRMKRRHSRADALRFVDTVRRLRPGVVFGADLIAGFPTEDEAMFGRSRSIAEEAGLTFLHVFPFSPRPGTPAARMPEVDRALVKDRAARLRAVGVAALARHLAAEQGATRRVLVERGGVGHTEHFTPTEIGFGRPGDVVAARVTGHTARALLTVAA